MGQHTEYTHISWCSSRIMAAIKLESHRPLVILYTPFPIPGWKFRPGGDCGSCFCSSKRSPVTDIDFYGGHCLLCVMNVFVERWPAIKISNGDKCNVPREQRNALPPVLAYVLARVLSLERPPLPSSNHREPRITLPLEEDEESAR